MMSNLKSKFSFLDPASNEEEQRSIPSQVAMLEEKFSQISKMVMDQEGMHNRTQAADREVDERLKSMTMRLH